MLRAEIERLMREDAWLRRLAGGLVPDAALADDVVQDTWVAALSQPRAPQRLRPWLRVVARNALRQIQRGEARRTKRQEIVARREALPSTASVVEDVSGRREVADALLRLDEPYRTTLYRRFFLDHSLKEIAEAEALALATVHHRIEVGLERMRTDLDRAHGGERRAWATALLVRAGREAEVAPVVPGTVALGLGMKLVLSAVFLGGRIRRLVVARRRRRGSRWRRPRPARARVDRGACATPFDANDHGEQGIVRRVVEWVSAPSPSRSRGMPRLASRRDS